MNKFFSLLKKELREMLTLQTIGMLLLMLFMMYTMGGMMSKSSEEAQEESSRITICDLDKTEFSSSVIEFLKHPSADMQNEVTLFELETDNYDEQLDKLGVKSFVILKKGFTDHIMAGERAEVEYISRMTSLSTMSNMNIGSETAVQLISAAVKTAIYSQMVDSGSITDDEAILLEAPVSVTEQTIVNGKTGTASQLLLYSSLYTKSLFRCVYPYPAGLPDDDKCRQRREDRQDPRNAALGARFPSAYNLRENARGGCCGASQRHRLYDRHE